MYVAEKWFKSFSSGIFNFRSLKASPQTWFSLWPTFLLKILRPLVHFSNEGQKSTKSDFQSQYSVPKIIWIFLNFFSLKYRHQNTCEHFLSTLFNNVKFWNTSFSKMIANFWPSLLKWNKGLELFMAVFIDLWPCSKLC